jgi:hypothetical protein
LSGCRVVGLSGCRVVGLSGCRVVGLSGCLADTRPLRSALASTVIGIGYPIGTNGQWLDDKGLGARIYDSDGVATVAEAKKIAEQLGGSLEDRGGIFPIGKNGPE